MSPKVLMKPAATRGASYMRIFNTALLLLTILMAVMALLPLFGLDLVLMGEGKLRSARIDEANLHLNMVRSAAFASFASFSVNYLRRRRPLSSVAPLLYFCIWALFFAPAYVFMYSEFQRADVAFLVFVFAITVVLYRENQKEAKTIFVEKW
ncbi:hypothetical protein OA010_01280 [Luminiphilus sp.]|nr:hypothetical protein [Luminiphilus sp.]